MGTEQLYPQFVIHFFYTHTKSNIFHPAFLYLPTDKQLYQSFASKERVNNITTTYISFGAIHERKLKTLALFNDVRPLLQTDGINDVLSGKLNFYPWTNSGPCVVPFVGHSCIAVWAIYSTLTGFWTAWCVDTFATIGTTCHIYVSTAEISWWES